MELKRYYCMFYPKGEVLQVHPVREYMIYVKEGVSEIFPISSRDDEDLHEGVTLHGRNNNEALGKAKLLPIRHHPDLDHATYAPMEEVPPQST